VLLTAIFTRLFSSTSISFCNINVIFYRICSSPFFMAISWAAVRFFVGDPIDFVWSPVFTESRSDGLSFSMGGLLRSDPSSALPSSAVV
jgi:hypothetical protein